MEAKGAPLSDDIILAKAQALGASLGQAGTPLPSNFKFSLDWLNRFKRSRGISFQPQHGEAQGADLNSVANIRRYGPILIEHFGIDHSHNMDETGLFWKRLPSRSLVTRKRAGRKLAKDRFTLCVTTSASGNKFPLLAIGKAKRPRCFGKKWVPSNIGIPYTNSTKAWQTGETFTHFLHLFASWVETAGEELYYSWITLARTSAPITRRPSPNGYATWGAMGSSGAM
ncbi:hypothetical protein CYMTET_30910 [Cymbomonas tetramitiformis]|uniref:HTH CENPB-type domain-containing protein n=1 Tax=Cymbomonas tetramitiformis TaxID=36881 RepID=A0AAE0KTF7_9CHLO|nr:hypothetical protein CYMTET_30910 [Cymbomonas tetramitiformis]